MGFLDLAVFILKQIPIRPVQHAQSAAIETGRAVRLDSDHLDRVVQKWMKQSDSVAARSHAGQQGLRQPPGFFHELGPGFAADDGLEIPHHHGIRRRPGHGTENVVRVPDGGGPVAHSLVGSIL